MPLTATINEADDHRGDADHAVADIAPSRHRVDADQQDTRRSTRLVLPHRQHDDAASLISRTASGACRRK